MTAEILGAAARRSEKTGARNGREESTTREGLAATAGRNL